MPQATPYCDIYFSDFFKVFKFLSHEKFGIWNKDSKRDAMREKILMPMILGTVYSTGKFFIESMSYDWKVMTRDKIDDFSQ